MWLPFSSGRSEEHPCNVSDERKENSEVGSEVIHGKISTEKQVAIHEVGIQCNAIVGMV
jgi:hypothetical protein